MDRLRFGPAGIPASYSGPVEGAVPYVREIGLDAMELEFVRGIWLKPEKAELLGELAKENDVVLTAHAPYYINLNARDRKKLEASKERIVKSAQLLYRAGGFSLVFHAAYYMGDDPETVTRRVREALSGIVEELQGRGVDIWLRPELMGKPSQWGDLEELLEVSREVEMVEPAVDFAHLHARHRGRYNSADEWRRFLETYEEALGSEALKRMHIHVSGIVYGKKGERYHVNLRESDLRYLELVEVLKEFDVRGVLISESPNLEEDALLLKRAFYTNA